MFGIAAQFMPSACCPHLCRAQNACPDAWLHEQLLEDRVHVAGGAPIAHAGILPWAPQLPWHHADAPQHLHRLTMSKGTKHNNSGSEVSSCKNMLWTVAVVPLTDNA